MGLFGHTTRTHARTHARNTERTHTPPSFKHDLPTTLPRPNRSGADSSTTTAPVARARASGTPARSGASCGRGSPASGIAPTRRGTARSRCRGKSRRRARYDDASAVCCEHEQHVVVGLTASGPTGCSSLFRQTTSTHTVLASVRTHTYAHTHTHTHTHTHIYLSLIHI